MKSNRSQKGERFDLRYTAGRFVLEGGIRPQLSKTEIEESAEKTFMGLIDRFEKEGRQVAHAGTANNYAPKVFADHPDAKGMAKAHFAKAMNRLFAQGKIEIEEYGPPSKRRNKLIRASRMQNDAGRVQEIDLFGGSFSDKS